MTLAKICRSNDVTFGLWHSGRSGSIPDIDLFAFPCLNILPLRILIPPGSGLREVASLIQTDLRERNRDIEQSNLLDIDLWIDGGGKPLCNVFVNILQSQGNFKGGILEQVDLVYHPPQPMTSYNPSHCKIAKLVQVS